MKRLKRANTPRTITTMSSNNNNNNRGTFNALSFLITISTLFIALQLTSGTFVNKISKMSENVDKALNKVIDEEKPEYTTIEIKTVYLSDDKFNPSGMAGLYNITKMFMDFIFPEDILPPGLINITSSGAITIEPDVPYLLKHFAGAVTIIAILLLFLVLMPLCGFCFCCCRCCGNCGSKVLPYDKKRDLCKKLILATILICLATLLIFGVVCAFVSNEQLKEGVRELPKNLDNAITDTDTFLNATRAEIDNVLGTNFDKFHASILKIFNESGQIFYDELLTLTQATSLNNITNIAEEMIDVQNELTTLKLNTNALRVYASQLNDAIRKVKFDLFSALKACKGIPVCNNFTSVYVNQLSTNIDFDNYLDRYFPKLPSIANELDKLDEFTTGSIFESLKKGEEKLEEIQADINKSITDNLDKVRQRVEEGARDVRKIKDDVSTLFSNFSSKLDEATEPALDKVHEYVPKYYLYLYYVGLTLSCVLLCVTVFITLGLICGVCGKRPAKHNEDCCNKGAGSTYLMCSVYLMFLFAAVFAFVAVVYFALGTVTQRAICDSLRNPRESTIIENVEKLIDLKQFNITANVTSVLETCHRNDSIYKVFELENTFNLTKLENFTQVYNVEDILENLQINIGENHIKFLDENGKKQLEDLTKSGISDIDYDKFIEELNVTSFTSITLDELREELSRLITNLTKERKSDLESTITQLEIVNYHLETYQTKIVDPIELHCKSVTETAVSLKVKMKFGHNSFNDAILSLLKELNHAEETINTEGQAILANITKSFAENVLDIITNYVTFSIASVEEKIGRCGPLSLVINGTITSTCDKIITPINGYWFCMLLSLLVFVPTIIFSIKLASLYKKSDASHHGLIIESDYLYDAYTDRDNIPLSGNPGKSNKKRNKRKNKRYDSRGVYSQELNEHSRDYPGGSNYPDNRYQDMAPKHWEEFPAGGPPQYQRAPTEYDRPPPYYYPATAAAAAAAAAGGAATEQQQQQQQ